VFLLGKLLPGIRMRSAGTAVLVAIIFSVLNFFLGWFVHLLLVIPGILSLGLLFLIAPFLVNVVMLWLTDKVLASFEIRSFGTLLFSALVITVVNGLYYAPHINALAHGYRGAPGAWI